jgi:hypothetical protein
MGIRNSEASNLRPVKRTFFIFLSLHHPNNPFENISILYLPLFTSVAKRKFLGIKNIEGALPFLLHPSNGAYG